MQCAHSIWLQDIRAEACTGTFKAPQKSPVLDVQFNPHKEEQVPAMAVRSLDLLQKLSHLHSNHLILYLPQLSLQAQDPLTLDLYSQSAC